MQGILPALTCLPPLDESRRADGGVALEVADRQQSTEDPMPPPVASQNALARAAAPVGLNYHGAGRVQESTRAERRRTRTGTRVVGASVKHAEAPLAPGGDPDSSRQCYPQW